MSRHPFSPQSALQDLSHEPTYRALGFTLIELIVVLVIMGLLSSLAIVSVSHTIDRNQLAAAAETIEIFDARLRREARSYRQPITAVIDVARNQMVFPQADGTQARFSLPSRAEIESVRSSVSRGGSNRLSLNVDIDGRSASYLIEIRTGSAAKFLVVLGASGQMVVETNRRAALAMLALETS